jgi:hypothetical protein
MRLNAANARRYSFPEVRADESRGYVASAPSVDIRMASGRKTILVSYVWARAQGRSSRLTLNKVAWIVVREAATAAKSRGGEVTRMRIRRPNLPDVGSEIEDASEAKDTLSRELCEGYGSAGRDTAAVLTHNLYLTPSIKGIPGAGRSTPAL